MTERAGVVERSPAKPGELLALLQEIQARYSYLPEEALRSVAAETGRSLVEIYGMATFYRGFSLKPRGKHLVTCCLGTACHVRGAPKVAEELERQLQVQRGNTTADRQFTLETQNCLGGCAVGPIVVVDGHYFPSVGPPAVRDILAKSREGLDKIDLKTDERVFPVEVACGRCNHSLMNAHDLIDGLPSIWVTASFGDRHGWLRLSSLYGSYEVESQHEIPLDAVVDFFCPHCSAELTGGGPCLACGASMVPMIVRGGGIVQTCSRRGCHNHMLDLEGTSSWSEWR